MPKKNRPSRRVQNETQFQNSKNRAHVRVIKAIIMYINVEIKSVTKLIRQLSDKKFELQCNE